MILYRLLLFWEFEQSFRRKLVLAFILAKTVVIGFALATLVKVSSTSLCVASFSFSVAYGFQAKPSSSKLGLSLRALAHQPLWSRPVHGPVPLVFEQTILPQILIRFLISFSSSLIWQHSFSSFSMRYPDPAPTDKDLRLYYARMVLYSSS